MSMNDEQAIEICREWFAYLERQKAKTKRLQELAALARTGPEGHAEAKRELRRIDRQPTVYDGARLLPAVKHLVSRLTPHRRAVMSDDEMRQALDYLDPEWESKYESLDEAAALWGVDGYSNLESFYEDQTYDTYPTQNKKKVEMTIKKLPRATRDPLPLAAAKDVMDKYNLERCIVIGVSSDGCTVFTVTYGADEDLCAMAAMDGGKIRAMLEGQPDSLDKALEIAKRYRESIK